MLQQPNHDDYMIATGETHSLRDFCELAFDIAGMDYLDYVVVDPLFFRPTEITILLGDYSKAKMVLGWTSKTTFRLLVEEMVESDLLIEKCRV